MDRLKRIFRWGLAILCLVGAYRLFRIGITFGITPAAFVFLVGMFFCVIVAVILLLPESLPVMTRPFTAFIDAVYGTGPGKGRPPLNYNLAQGYVKQSRMEEALAEYRRILKLYPHEAEAYRETIILLLREFEDREGASKLLTRGLRKVRSGEERDILKATYEAELSGLEERKQDVEAGT